MARFGVPSVGACYAASAGLRQRDTARVVGDAFERHGGGSFVQFLAWLNALAPEDISAVARGDHAAVLVERVAVLAGHRGSLTLLANGEGVVRASVRGLAYDDRWHRVIALGIPSTVLLEREPLNPHDRHAVLVRTGSGEPLGYVAREVARGVAPLLDAGLQADAELVSRDGDDPAHVGGATIEIRLFTRATPARTAGTAERGA